MLHLLAVHPSVRERWPFGVFFPRAWASPPLVESAVWPPAESSPAGRVCASCVEFRRADLPLANANSRSVAGQATRLSRDRSLWRRERGGQLHAPTCRRDTPWTRARVVPVITVDLDAGLRRGRGILLLQAATNRPLLSQRLRAGGHTLSPLSPCKSEFRLRGCGGGDGVCAALRAEKREPSEVRPKGAIHENHIRRSSDISGRNRIPRVVLVRTTFGHPRLGRARPAIRLDSVRRGTAASDEDSHRSLRAPTTSELMIVTGLVEAVADSRPSSRPRAAGSRGSPKAVARGVRFFASLPPCASRHVFAPRKRVAR